MKHLYLISQNKNTGYDLYDSAVVCANTEEEAREINPGGFYKWHDGSWWFQYADGTERAEKDYSWTDIKYVKVKKIGEADDSIRVGVVCASFNAG